MAKTKTDKAEKNEEVVRTGNDILTSMLKQNVGDHHNFSKSETWHSSTGSLLLDVATGGLQPSLIRLAGVNNSGKTPQALEMLRNFLKDVPNSKGLWTIAEGRGLSAENRARCGLTFVSDPADWKVGTVFLLETNVFELFINTVKSLVKENEEGTKYAFVVDSVDGLILRDDAAKEITEANRVAGVPMLAKKMLQSLSLGMFKYGHLMILISQVTAEIKLDPYSKGTNRGGNFSGGNSLLHGSDVIIQYEGSYNGDFILDDKNGRFNDGKTKPIGQNVRVTLVKSIKEATKKTLITYPVKYGRKPSGIWVEREIGDLLLMWELVKKAEKGSWLSVTESLREEVKKETDVEMPEKLQGEPKVYQYLEDNPKVTEYLLGKFKALIS